MPYPAFQNSLPERLKLATLRARRNKCFKSLLAGVMHAKHNFPQREYVIGKNVKNCLIIDVMLRSRVCKGHILEFEMRLGEKGAGEARASACGCAVF
jgi:hypothetical protein